MTHEQPLQRAQRLGERGSSGAWLGLDFSDVTDDLALSRSGSHALLLACFTGSVANAALVTLVTLVALVVTHRWKRGAPLTAGAQPD